MALLFLMKNTERSGITLNRLLKINAHTYYHAISLQKATQKRHTTRHGKHTHYVKILIEAFSPFVWVDWHFN
jgi:hypothetical protein